MILRGFFIIIMPMQNHRNEDGSYTYYVEDGSGVMIPVCIPKGYMADEIDKLDRKIRNGDIRWRYLNDVSIYSCPFCDDEGFTYLDMIPDNNVDVEAAAIQDEIEESQDTIKVREIIRTLPPKLQELFYYRYECHWRLIDIAKMDGKGRTAISMRDRKLKDIVEARLREDKGCDTDAR